MASAPPAQSTPTNAANNPSTNTQYLPLAILTSLFFLWGFITCLNDILIPHLKAAFSLDYAQAALIQFAFFTAYALLSLPSGALVKRVGYQRGIVIGLVISGLGCLLFYPAAATRLYPLFLGALFVLASGITLLQVSANPFVTLLGPPQTASSRLNLTQAFNSLGTTLAPLFGAALILSVKALGATDLLQLSPAALTTYKAAEASSVQIPYVGLAVVLLLIAVAFGLFKLPHVEGNHKGGAGLSDYAAALRRYPHLAFGVIAIFAYVGAEVSIGSFLVNFMKQPDIGGFTDQSASRYLPLYWGGAMVGRFIGSAVMTKVKPGLFLGLFAFIAAALSLSTMALGGTLAMGTILGVGLFNSIMFPTIFSLSLNGLGEETPLGSGLLCMAIVGGAIMPVAFGVVADSMGLHHAFWVPAICYLYIAWFGLKGSSERQQ